MRDRNRRELQQLGRVARSLNRCGVRPVLLKGAASLVAGTYPETAGRFLSDIDLLVPQGAIEDCATALEADGYRADPAVVGTFRQRRACFHHYPRLFHPQEPAGDRAAHRARQGPDPAQGGRGPGRCPRPELAGGRGQPAVATGIGSCTVRCTACATAGRASRLRCDSCSSSA